MQHPPERRGRREIARGGEPPELFEGDRPAGQWVTCRGADPSEPITQISIAPERSLWKAMSLPSWNQTGTSSAYDPALAPSLSAAPVEAFTTQIRAGTSFAPD
jgi:hypothetical protein